MSSPSIQDILQQYWGYPDFRPQQADIIQSVLAGHDTLALLPTGGGKSICFQVPGLALSGLCLVVSPLIALMKDQVAQLQKRGITAQALYTGLDRAWIDRYLDEAADGKLKFLYLSPERLKTELFLARVTRMPLSLLAIDEAHCISQWGYDFRPAYLEISAFRALYPQLTTIALTASATPQVQEDIRKKLHFRPGHQTFQSSFARANLSYSVFEEEDKARKLQQIMQKVPGTAVIYVRNRKHTQVIAELLRKQGFSADYYHAGLPHSQRAERQEAWTQDQTRIIVATNAFGMGIDKPDVRVVVHWDLPDSLEAYYQEAGRAGRDGQKAYAVALYTGQDLDDMQKKIETAYPPLDFIRRVYQALANYFHLAVNAGEMQSFDFDLAQFQNQFNLKGNATYFALKRLEEEGLIQFNEAYYSPSRIMFALDFKELYEFQLKNPGAEPILTLLSRLRGGDMQSHFFTISENQLAYYLQKSSDNVRRQLERLQSLGILHYDFQRDMPQILFLQPRFEATRLPLDKARLDARKKTALERVAAVRHYALHRHRCRTQLLLEYFGEISEALCGVCDFCLASKKNKWRSLRDENARRIQEALEAGPLALPLLVARMPHLDERETLQCIREMLDTGEIQRLEDGRMALAKSS
ncbi:MAG: ATP-dependent DNA helicase RecQ [Microscillaceae bacterium]